MAKIVRAQPPNGIVRMLRARRRWRWNIPHVDPWHLAFLDETWAKTNMPYSVAEPRSDSD